jgi:hypothetical protein
MTFLMDQLRASLVLEQVNKHSTEIVPVNPRAVIGSNQPPGSPGCIDTARGVYANLAAFLKDTPVIQTPDEAKRGANLIEQARATLGEMDDERKGLVAPLNDEVKAINAQYRKPRESVEAIVDEIRHRLTVFAQAEEGKRLAIAEATRLAAVEAERIAREAERIEADAKACADVGECDVNVAAAIVNADRAFDTFKRTGREAARAERETTVRLNGGFGRAVSMRSKETLVLDDAHAAIAAMGLSDGIKDAILSSARAYRKLNGRLPAGVSAERERQF